MNNKECARFYLDHYDIVGKDTFEKILVALDKAEKKAEFWAQMAVKKQALVDALCVELDDIQKPLRSKHSPADDAGQSKPLCPPDIEYHGESISVDPDEAMAHSRGIRRKIQGLWNRYVGPDGKTRGDT